MEYKIIIEDLLCPGYPRTVTIESTNVMECHKQVMFDELTNSEEIVEIRDQDDQIVYGLDGFVNLV